MILEMKKLATFVGCELFHYKTILAWAEQIVWVAEGSKGFRLFEIENLKVL